MFDKNDLNLLSLSSNFSATVNSIIVIIITIIILLIQCPQLFFFSHIFYTPSPIILKSISDNIPISYVYTRAFRVFFDTTQTVRCDFVVYLGNNKYCYNFRHYSFPVNRTISSISHPNELLISFQSEQFGRAAGDEFVHERPEFTRTEQGASVGRLATLFQVIFLF